MHSQHYNNAKVFKAFCDETRLAVLALLQDGEKCACVLLVKLKIKQPTLSHHMKILVESGVVSARKCGKWTFYSLSEEGSEYAAKLLRELTTAAVDKIDKSEEFCI
jgi:ArsR family transcriptional regulator